MVITQRPLSFVLPEIFNLDHFVLVRSDCSNTTLTHDIERGEVEGQIIVIKLGEEVGIIGELVHLL